MDIMVTSVSCVDIMDQVFLVATNVLNNHLFDRLVDCLLGHDWPHAVVLGGVLLVLFFLVVIPNYDRLRSHWSWWI